MTSALLIIDVQNILCRGQWAAHEADELIARINDVSARARKSGSPVVLVQHESQDGPMQRGQDGWQLSPLLTKGSADVLLAKTTCDSFLRTELEELLWQANVSEVTVCGMQSEFCVDSTVRGALARGFGVTLLSDGHSTLNNGGLSASQIIAHHNATLSNIESFGPRVTLKSCAQAYA
jgi:nicotinamidase-related amidase